MTRTIQRQIKNLFKLIRGQPLSYPPLGSATLDADDVRLVRYWLKHPQDWYNIDQVNAFEKEFASWNGSRHAVAFMGGRVALTAAINALRMKPGDEVIVPGYTCVVVPNAFSYAGIRVVYSDIELETYGLDASLLQSKITPRTKAILIQHLYGLVCRDYEAILHFAHNNNLSIIEDCAHATGATYKGRNVGTRSDVAFYSAEQSKVFTTIQGGIAVTDSPEIAKNLREFSDKADFPSRHSITNLLYGVILNYYTFKHPHRWITRDFARLLYGKYKRPSTTPQELCGIQPVAYGQRMPAPLASLGCNQLAKLDMYNQRRREAATIWDHWARMHDFTPPLVIEHSVPVFLRYPLLVDKDMKQNIDWAKTELNVKAGVWFISHIHPTYVFLSDCPNAQYAVERCINFPCILRKIRDYK